MASKRVHKLRRRNILTGEIWVFEPLTERALAGGRNGLSNNNGTAAGWCGGRSLGVFYLKYLHLVSSPGPVVVGHLLVRYVRISPIRTQSVRRLARCHWYGLTGINDPRGPHNSKQRWGAGAPSLPRWQEEVGSPPAHPALASHLMRMWMPDAVPWSAISNQLLY
jgi:hypothetical protein